MNSLSYGLLSLLSREPRSGYDLMLKIQPFWQAKHSQIYPLLSKLEAQGYVEHELIEQKDKPDKKVYSITGQGIVALQSWLSQPTNEPALRDELLFKIYASYLCDRQTTIQLLEERIGICQKRMLRLEGLMREIPEQALELGAPDPITPDFSRYILIQRSIEVVKSEIEWCKWAIGLFEGGQKK